MLNPKDVFATLVRKYLDNEASEAEIDALQKYYALFKDEPDGITGLNAEDIQRIEDRLLLRIRERLQLGEAKVIRPFFSRTLTITIAAAAALILLSATAILFKNDWNSKEESLARIPAASHPQTIQPGGNKAILILGNGRKVELETMKDGEVLEMEGVKLIKREDGLLTYQVKSSTVNLPGAVAFNTIVTPRGGAYRVELPDGTKVWLNAASSLTYPVDFDENSREVSLKGEAYFEVAKAYRSGAHKSRLPFIVKTELQEVEVLGTHFNVNTYDDKLARTTLYEGSVKVFRLNPVSKTKTKDFKLLKPGQELLVAEKQITLIEAPLKASLAWKNGLFIFEDENIQDIMNTISRWYNIDVVYDGKISTERFSAEISRDKDIKTVLELLELTNLVHFKIEGRRVIVMP